MRFNVGDKVVVLHSDNEQWHGEVVKVIPAEVAYEITYRGKNNTLKVFSNEEIPIEAEEVLNGNQRCLIIDDDEIRRKRSTRKMVNYQEPIDICYSSYQNNGGSGGERDEEEEEWDVLYDNDGEEEEDDEEYPKKMMRKGKKKGKTRTKGVAPSVSPSQPNPLPKCLHRQASDKSPSSSTSSKKKKKVSSRTKMKNKPSRKSRGTREEEELEEEEEEEEYPKMMMRRGRKKGQARTTNFLDLLTQSKSSSSSSSFNPSSLHSSISSFLFKKKKKGRGKDLKKRKVKGASFSTIGYLSSFPLEHLSDDDEREMEEAISNNKRKRRGEDFIELVQPSSSPTSSHNDEPFNTMKYLRSLSVVEEDDGELTNLKKEKKRKR